MDRKTVFIIILHMSIWSALKKAFQVFISAPLLFLIIQIPETSVDILGRILPLFIGKSPYMLALSLFPYFCIASFVSLSATFLAVTHPRSSLRNLITQIGHHFSVLAATSILTGALVFMGFIAFILPGFYLMALYIYVPILVLSPPRQPWSSYLQESKVLAKRHLRSTLTIVLLVMGLGLFLELGLNVPDSFLDPWNHSLVMIYVFKLFISSVLGALAAVWIAVYIKEIQGST